MIRGQFRPEYLMSSPSLPSFEAEFGARLARNDFAGAAAVAAGCRAAWPADRAGWLLGSIAALLAEQKEAALALIEERLGVHPRDVQCLLQKAECLMALGSRAESLKAADAAADGANAAQPALDAVGEFFVYAREHTRALQVYDRAVAACPMDPSLLAKRAVVQGFLGNFERAEADYAAVLALTPGDAHALAGLAELRRQTATRNHVEAMQAALAAAPAASTDAIVLYFGLAKSYEDLGDYPLSWRHVSAGNRLERSRFQYEPRTDREAIERTITGFAEVETIWPDTTGESPIFIVGLPRTGTTLVERIIGSNSAVHSAGELSALSEAIGSTMQRAGGMQAGTWLDYAAALANLDGAPIAREYLARARARRGVRPRFSDKQPTNFYYCALILRAFPRARIVHLSRHPLATCYAIYKTRFDKAYPFAYDLAELGDFYIGYRKLMAHWHQVLPGRLLELPYEEVVTAQEQTTRRLLEYLDLPFEEACLDFHLNPDPTATASRVQVRQPLYQSSLEQWRHYAAELAPLRARLEAAGIAVD
jgi:tetratricopeptide (TPR) repeat protein